MPNNSSGLPENPFITDELRQIESESVLSGRGLFDNQEVSFSKTGDRAGSNPGGWYEDFEGSRWYLKFYPNEDNARMEYLANVIYKRLGVKAPESSLFLIKKRIAIGSRDIDGQVANIDEQKSSSDVQNGFLADCYLNNWDVVGQFFDNLVKGKDGHVYRIDNAGCGPLRANGLPKPFLPDAMPEIFDMRNPKFQSGQVFQNVSDLDIKIQAEAICQKLSIDDINILVEQVGFDPKLASLVKDGLIGRLNYLSSLS